MPDAQRKRPVALERRLQVRVARRPPGEPVDALVEAHERLRVVARGLVELGREQRGLLAQLGGHALGGEPRGVRLELRAHLGEARDVLRMYVCDDRPAARADLHEVLERQALDRLAQRRAPDSHLAHELVLAQPGAGRKAQVDDAVAQAEVRTIGELLRRGSRWRLTGRHGTDISTPMAGADAPVPPGRARVVIVGAGIAGASLAYHLARLGWSDVVLVEQGPLWETGGSTSHAPGLMFQLNPSHTMTRLARRSVALYGSLELEGLPCFHAVGGIEVAATQERWEELDRRYGRGLSYGLQPQLLSPDEVAERIPLVDPQRILGGLLVPDDGIGKALRAAEALGRGAAGLQAFGDCLVTGVE